MNWFRLYHEIIFDPKLRRFSPEIRWRFVEILCIASMEKDRGMLPDLWTIADHFHLTESKASKIVDQFVEAGLITKTDDGKRFAVKQWNKRQFANDSSVERTRDYRDRLKASLVTSHVTSQDRHEDVTETVTVTASEYRGQNTDTEEEKKKEKINKKKKPEFVLPDWIPADDWDAFVEMRSQIKKPLTDRAMTMAVNELSRLKATGQDPGRVIQQSVMRCYQGLFRVDGDSKADTEPEVTNYVIAPPDSPWRKQAAEDSARLLAIFGGKPDEQGGSPATAKPGSGTGSPGIVPTG